MPSKDKKSGAGRSSKLGYAFGALLLIGCVIALGRSGSKKPAAESREAPALLSREISAQSPPKVFEPFTAEAYRAEIEQKRARLAAKQFLGLKTLELTADNGVFKIPFTFKPRKVWCQGGDLDTMKYASDDPSAQDILISLEPLAAEGKGDFMRTSVAALYNGVEHVFKLKAADKPRTYGLYICTARTKTTSCKGKTLISHDEISKDLAQGGRDAAKKAYIFYFQQLILDKNILETYRTNDFSSVFRTSVEAYLISQKGVGRSEFQQAWDVSQVTRSKPADLRDGRVVLSLPHNDPRCMRAGRVEN